MGQMNEADKRSRQKSRAMLARFKPIPRWMNEERPSPQIARLGIAVVRAVMTHAALTPDEERAVTVALELDASMGVNHASS